MNNYDELMRLVDMQKKYFVKWRNGEIVIKKAELLSMVRRYLYLRDLGRMSDAEYREWVGLYSWFSLYYSDRDDLPHPTVIVSDIDLLYSCGLPISKQVGGGGVV